MEAIPTTLMDRHAVCALREGPSGGMRRTQGGIAILGYIVVAMLMSGIALIPLVRADDAQTFYLRDLAFSSGDPAYSGWLAGPPYDLQLSTIAGSSSTTRNVSAPSFNEWFSPIYGGPSSGTVTTHLWLNTSPGFSGSLPVEFAFINADGNTQETDVSVSFSVTQTSPTLFTNTTSTSIPYARWWVRVFIQTDFPLMITFNAPTGQTGDSFVSVPAPVNPDITAANNTVAVLIIVLPGLLVFSVGLEIVRRRRSK